MEQNLIHRQLLDERGGSRLGWLLTILIFLCGFYACWQIFPFYYYYYELVGLMEEQANKAQVFTDDEIRRNIEKKIKELDIPVDDMDDLKINRFNGKIVIDLQYSEVLYVDLGDKTYDLYTFQFNPHVEKDY